MTDPRDKLLRGRKVRDRSMVHLMVGLVLLMPPVIGVSLMDVRIAGVPAPLAYVFGVWALLIVVALVLAGPLSSSETSSPPPDRADPDG